MEVLRKYGVATTILFPLVDAGAIDFESTPVTFVAADCQISKNEGAFANTGSTPIHEGGGIYSLALTATQMQAARIVITVIDAATKAWEDQAVLIATYGNASAQHAFDLDLAEQLVALSATGKTDVNTEADTALTDYDAATGAEVATVQSDTDDIQARLPTALVSGRIDASVGAMASGVITAAAIAANAITAAKIAANAIGATQIATGAITAAKFAANAITATVIAAAAFAASKFAADTDTYQAKAWLIDDDDGSNDRYMVAYYKNGNFVSSGVTVPTIWVFTAGAADLLGTSASPQALTEIGTTHTFQHAEGTSRIVSGVAYMARVRATIDGSTRTWMQPVGRDT